MRSAARLSILGALGLAGLAVAAPAAAARPVDHHSADRAVFVQTDGLDGNAVAAYARAADGTLVPAGEYPTGGVGGILTGSVVDHQASQGALHYDTAHRLLFATNAGSDTVTVFRVEGAQLRRVQVIGSGGRFPSSVTVHGDLVYVLNSRDGGSVQGFVILGDRLVRVPEWNRPLGLNPAATPEFTHTPGQVTFDPSGTRLLVTTKAAANSIDVFHIGRFGTPSATPTVTSLPGDVPFAVVFDPAGHAVVAEVGNNSVGVFDLGADDTFSPVSTTPTGQAGTCWVVADGTKVYASNAGSGSLSGFRIAGDGSAVTLGNTATDAGTVDAAVSRHGRFLYVQAGAAGNVDEFAVGADGTLTALGSVAVPGAAGGEGIAAS